MSIQKKQIKKVVLAYSGGLDTSAIIPWLKENYDNCEVIAFCADVGQGEEELEGIKEKAIASGASECYVADLKEEYVKDYIYPILKTISYNSVLNTNVTSRMSHLLKTTQC